MILSVTALRAAAACAVVALLASAAAQGQQQLYRWTDDKGRTHITDTPPPASAKDVQKKAAVTGGADPGQVPYELAVAIQNFPVVLYTAPSCSTLCDSARSLLNRRGVPFREVQVTDEKTSEELKALAGSNGVPALVVGRSVQSGFEEQTYHSLLDAARYPRTGAVRPRAQAAPPSPAEAEASAKAAAAKSAEAAAAPRGPYAPGAPPQRATQRPATKQ